MTGRGETARRTGLGRPLGRWLPALAIGLLAALAELGGETLRIALRYDRDGLAGGELWRLITGHLVHLGPSHMAMNVVALAVLAILFAALLRPADWLAAALVAALSIDAGLYLRHPGVEWYVGLSGVLHGIWAAACVAALLTRRPGAIALSLLLLGKLIYEAALGSLPLTGSVADGPVITAAHAWGAAGGAVAMLAIRRPGRRL